MKKLLCIIFAAVVACGTLMPVSAAYLDIDQSGDYYLSALRLQDLDIVSGYDDSTFRPDNRITRAEFTKIVICMMDKEKQARTAVYASGFFDVPNGSWAAPYINYAVSQDILSGYSDGSFGPDRTISMSEALTILLRTLGYDESVVGYFWPNNYMEAAASLGITDGLNYPADAPLTRATAAILTDRAMFTKPAKTENADTYLETIGFTVLDDALILDRDTSSDNVSILAGNLKLNNSSTYISDTQIQFEIGDMFEHAVIDKNGYLATVKAYGTDKGMYSETAVINRLTGNTIEFTTTDGRKGTYKADDSFVTYYDNNKMTFANARGYAQNGADITFYGNSYGLWNIAVIGSSNDVDPILATHSYTDDSDNLEGRQINKKNLVIYRDGEAASLSDIKAKDVVYYNTKTNTMDVYSKKITGVYYSAYPSKAYVESISVGGKSYEIGYSAATRKLDASSGAFNIGDKVTLLLGKDDKIAFVTDNSGAFDYFEYGVILSSVTRTATEGANNGNTEFVTAVFMADGEAHEIITDKIYKESVGDFVRISYSGGKATLTRQNVKDNSDYAGSIDFERRTVGGRYVLKDAAIIQQVSDDEASVTECKLLDFDNLTVNKIDEGHIINVVTANKFGDIAIMYVENLESVYEYGVVTGFEKKGNAEGGYETIGYKIFSNGMASSYMLGNAGRISTSVGSGVGFCTQNGSISKIVALSKLGSASGVGAVEGSRIMLKNTVYKMAEDVEIVDITSTTNIRTISIDELASMNNIVSVTLYSDKTISNGGVVRVVTVKTSN